VSGINLNVGREGLERAGFWFAWGALRLVGAFMLFGLLLTLALNGLGLISTDDSDVSRFDRSGLKVRTDAKTGCEYLETHEGSLFPRLDALGKPICGTVK
jgi:hypothetical protein